MSLRDGKAVNIVSAKPMPGYKLQVSFDDGHVSTVDFGTFLKTAHHAGIQKYLEPSQFKSFSIVHGNLVWGDYDMCFPVADLYQGDVMPHSHTAQAVAESRSAYGRK